jgi:hypothetical protein
MAQKRYSEGDLIDALRMLYDLLGRTPRTRDADAHPDVPSGSTYIKRFGSWLNALETAGCKPDASQMGYDRETLLSHLQDLAKRLGRTPTREDLKTEDGPRGGTYYRRFGSFPRALREAGLEPEHGPRGYDRTELLDILRQLAAEVGHTPRACEADTHPDVPTANTYINHFGSWLEALEAADLPPDGRQTGYDRVTLLSHLQDLAESLGRAPTRGELHEAGGPTVPVYESHFGSWPQALREAGLEFGRRFKRYDRDELLDILKELAEELGHTPSTSELWEREDLPSPATYQNHFGRWNAALREAGLPSLRVSRRPRDAREEQEGLTGKVTGSTRHVDGPTAGRGDRRQPLCSIEEDYTGRRVTAFMFDGNRHRAASWTGAAAELFGVLCAHDRQQFEETAVTIAGYRYPYFAHDFRRLRKPARIRGTDMFFDASLNANMSAKLCYTVIERMGFDRSVLSFETEA